LLEKNSLPQIEQELVQVYLKLNSDPKQIVATLARSLERQAAQKKSEEGRPTFGQIVIQPPSAQIQVQEEKTFTQELVSALAAQGEKAKSTVPLLLKTFDAANPSDKIAIVSALGKIDSSAGDAMPVLRKQLQSDNAELRQAAAEAIEAITRKQEP
jgi:HEAT repeat protein